MHASVTSLEDGSPAHEWDADQKAVIFSHGHRRIIVDAGPGTGKTAVACARIAHLVNECGLSPTRVWMISFTRTAVAEIRGRLSSYVGPLAAGIKVATVDSQAWAIHSGFDPKAKLTGTYESNVHRVLELLEQDAEVADYLWEIEHLIVDEAQDLVGTRGELVEALLRKLNPECGITVFCDEAQAIYGWSEDQNGEPAAEPETSLSQNLRCDEALRFEFAELTTIHRTRSGTLREIFSGVRSTVVAAQHSAAGLFTTVRDRIHALADGKDLEATKLGIDQLPAGTLILFRMRAEALMASQFCQAPHSLRLSGFPKSLPPWISACFAEYTDRYVSRDRFAELWAEHVAGNSRLALEDTWETLLSLAAGSGHVIDLKLLRQILGRANPPIELMDPEFGLAGPILGTIHASKGREADDVLLIVPRSEEFKNEQEEHSETRILFVGSTRARKSLKVGKAIAWAGKPLDSGRACRIKFDRGKASAMVEVGRDNDLLPENLIGRKAISAGEARAAQAHMKASAENIYALELLRIADADWNYRLVTADGNQPLAMLPPWFKEDLWKIAKIAAAKTGGEARTPYRLRHVRALGSRSVVLPSGDPRLEVMHSPWRESGFLLAPRLASFTTIFL